MDTKAENMSVQKTGTILDLIVKRKHFRLEEAKRAVSFSRIRECAEKSSPSRDFLGSLKSSPGVALIAEIKRASPSRGILCPRFDPCRLARNYEEAGADAVSVITEADFFKGTLESLARVRKTMQLPLLRKDFLFDGYQIYEARAMGADAVLLIAAILENGKLRELLLIGESLGMSALVEVHTDWELERALQCGASMIGINNRNLKTMSVDLKTSKRLLPRIPGRICRVVESGIQNSRDIRSMGELGADAVLVGEAIVRHPDPGEKILELMK
jgi:indole-3-glycerol phosphate synthase